MFPPSEPTRSAVNVFPAGNVPSAVKRIASFIEGHLGFGLHERSTHPCAGTAARAAKGSGYFSGRAVRKTWRGICGSLHKEADRVSRACVRPSVRRRYGNDRLASAFSHATPMTTFSYSITDLSHYESDLIEVTWESEDEAVDFGSAIAGEMLERMPELARKGWSVTVYDSQRRLLSIVPIGAVS